MNYTPAKERRIEYAVQPDSYFVLRAARTTLRLSAMPQQSDLSIVTDILLAGMIRVLGTLQHTLVVIDRNITAQRLHDWDQPVSRARPSVQTRRAALDKKADGRATSKPRVQRDKYSAQT